MIRPVLIAHNCDDCHAVSRDHATFVIGFAEERIESFEDSLGIAQGCPIQIEVP